MQLSATLPTPMGLFTLTADETGLCGLSFPTETPPAALSQVEIAAHPLLNEAGRQLLAYLDGSRRTFDLPLSIHGTAFQLQVWEQLRTIAYGRDHDLRRIGRTNRRAAKSPGRGRGRPCQSLGHRHPLSPVDRRKCPTDRLRRRAAHEKGPAGSGKERLGNAEKKNVKSLKIRYDAPSIHFREERLWWILSLAR